MSYTGIEGIIYNDATGMYEPERKTFYDAEGNEVDMNATFGGRNITLGDSRSTYGSTPQKTPEQILSETVATLNTGGTTGDTGDTSGTSTSGFDLAAYMAGLQSDIDSYVPGAYGAGFLDEVEKEDKVKAEKEKPKKEEEPYVEEITKLKLPSNVFTEVSKGRMGLEEDAYKDKKITFDGKGFDHYMETDGDKKEIQPMLDAGMSKAEMKRWGKALGIRNVDEKDEAREIVDAFKKGYLPGQKPTTTFELTDKVQDRFGNVFTKEDYKAVEAGGASAKEIENFLKDYTKGGGRVTDKVYDKLGVFGALSKDYGNKLSGSEIKTIEAAGASKKDIKNFLKDYVEQGNKVGKQVREQYSDFKFL